MTWEITTPESTVIDVPNNESENVTNQELTLSFLVSRDKRNELRRLADNAGEIEVDNLAGGRFRVTDMSDSGTDNTYTLSPPGDRSDVSYSGEVLVDNYSERRIGNTAETYRITVTLVKRRTREESGGYLNESPVDGEWTFEFADGTITKRRGIDAESIEEDVSGTAQLQLSVALTFEETRILREVSNQFAGDGVEDVSVSDGPDEVVDNTGRNTVTVTAPSGGEDLLASGTYIVTDWSLEWTGLLYQAEIEFGV